MEIEQEFEQNTDFVDQFETNIVDVENLVGKNYTLGGLPNVYTILNKKKTYNSADDKADERFLYRKKQHKTPGALTARVIPPKSSYSVQALDRVMRAPLTPHDVHLFLTYLSDRYPPERFFATGDLGWEVGHE